MHLKNIINDLYRDLKSGSKIIGDGGAMDALRYKLKTGEKVGGKAHSTKIKEYSNGLNRIIKNPNLSNGDKSKAEWLINNINDAMKGGDHVK